MKKTYLIAAMSFLYITTGLASCSKDNPLPVQKQSNNTNNSTDTTGNNSSEEILESDTINLKIANHTFTITLADNETAKAFKAKLPMTITMHDLNNNEKYYNMPDNLPTASYRPDKIQTGDLMLYGSNCIVLFYKTFTNSYNYTRIGKVDNPVGLVTAVGNGSISIIIELQTSK